MRNHGFDNLDLLEQIGTPEYASSQKRIQKIYGMVMEKAEIPVKRMPFGGKRTLLVAAVAAVGIVLAAAGYFSASDAFRSHLKEQGQNGQTTELSSLSPIVDKSGSVLQLAKPVVNDGIQITPRAIAGDDSTFTVLLDIVSLSGEPLGLEQEDGSRSDGAMMFHGYQFSGPTSNNEFGRFSMRALETKLNGSKGTILLRFDVYQPVPMGETIHIKLGDLKQHATLKGQKTGLDTHQLYETIAKFPAVNEDAIGDAAAFTGHNGHSLDEMQALNTDSEYAVPLSGALQGYTLTNAAIQGDMLYLRGYLPEGTSERNASITLRAGAIVSEDNSITFSSEAIHIGVRDSNAPQPWCIAFPGITSVEQLKNLELLVNHEQGTYTYVEGEWDYSFPLQYERVLREFSPNEKITMNGHSGTLENIQVSPYKVVFRFVPDQRAKTEQEIEEIRDGMQEAPPIQLKDGTVVEPISHEVLPRYQDKYAEPQIMKSIDGFYNFGAVIDPEQVADFQFGQYHYSVK